MKEIDPKDVHKGHRERMRRKLIAHGGGIFDTYELLEMLLYFAVRNKDTNPLAKRLLDGLGSLDGVLSADADRLAEVVGVGTRTAELIGAVDGLHRVLKMPTAPAESVYDDYDAVGRYFVEAFGNGFSYKTAIMLLDNSMCLLGMKIIYEGFDFHSGGVKAGDFVREAVSLGASVAILAHSHPYGPLCQTEGDNRTNQAVAAELSEVGVMLLEHYIITGERYRGTMRDRQLAFLQEPALERFVESSKRSMEVSEGGLS